MLGIKPKDAQLSTREDPNNMKLLLFEHEEALCSTDLGWADGGRGIPKISKPWPRDRCLALTVSSPRSQALSGHILSRRYTTSQPALIL